MFEELADAQAAAASSMSELAELRRQNKELQKQVHSLTLARGAHVISTAWIYKLLPKYGPAASCSMAVRAVAGFRNA